MEVHISRNIIIDQELRALTHCMPLSPPVRLLVKTCGVQLISGAIRSTTEFFFNPNPERKATGIIKYGYIQWSGGKLMIRKSVLVQQLSAK